MPHKHKRKRDDEKDHFDLPPSSHANALPTFSKKPRDSFEHTAKKPNPKSKRQKQNDDTPKAFARLLAFQSGKPRPSGLDNGESEKTKKRKAEKSEAKSDAIMTSTAPQQPKILAGERLSDFNLRVDQSLPLSMPKHTPTAKSTPKISGVKERSTKHNKKLLRMQTEWRATEKRLQEKKEEELDELEDQREEEDLLWDPVKAARTRKQRHKQKDEEYDPWAELAKTRADAKQKNLQDVVQAPPQLKRVKSKFKDDGAQAGVDVFNVPGEVGSLRKREEMSAARKTVIDEYRKMMRRGGSKSRSVTA